VTGPIAGASPGSAHKAMRQTCRRQPDVPLSTANRRCHAEHAIQTVDKALSYTATFRAQNTQSPLYATEWFAIGQSLDGARFDGESALSAEKGFFLRNE